MLSWLHGVMKSQHDCWGPPSPRDAGSRAAHKLWPDKQPSRRPLPCLSRAPRGLPPPQQRESTWVERSPPTSQSLLSHQWDHEKEGRVKRWLWRGKRYHSFPPPQAPRWSSGRDSCQEVGNVLRALASPLCGLSRMEGIVRGPSCCLATGGCCLLSCH